MTIRLLLDVAPSSGDEVLVTGAELAYLSGVRRARPGDALEIVAQGAASLARVEKIQSKSAVLRVERANYRICPSLPVELGVSVPKRQIMEDVVRVASELGVRVVRPLLLDRTVMEPSQGKLERWRRVAEESMRQCGRTQMLEVTEPCCLQEFLALAAASEVSGFVLHPGGPGRFPWRVSPSGGLSVLVGPEGGLCDAEFELAVQAGFIPVSLGETILRIETAAMVAAALSVAATDSWLEDIDFNQYQHKNS